MFSQKSGRRSRCVPPRFGNQLHHDVRYRPAAPSALCPIICKKSKNNDHAEICILPQETVMQKRSLGGLNLTAAGFIWVILSCASQESSPQGVISESNFEQIAAIVLTVARLPEEAALAGYFTAHEDPEVNCVTGGKLISAHDSKRINISYEHCGFESITWNGVINQPVDTEALPCAIFFGRENDNFGFFQTDATFFAPFAEEIGFSFKGDLSVDHLDQSDRFSATSLDIYIHGNTYDDLHIFRNLRVERSYDGATGRHAFAVSVEISSDMIPSVTCDVLTRFERQEDHYPHKGEMTIVAAGDGSRVNLLALPCGTQLLLRLDSDNDAVFEYEHALLWEEIRYALPEDYQSLFSYYWHS